MLDITITFHNKQILSTNGSGSTGSPLDICILVFGKTCISALGGKFHKKN